MLISEVSACLTCNSYVGVLTSDYNRLFVVSAKIFELNVRRTCRVSSPEPQLT
jgi:hypothetical protein